MIYERLPAVDTARERETCLRSLSVATIVKDDIDRSIRRIHRHPREELNLPVLHRIVIHTQRTRPRFSPISRRHQKHVRITIAGIDPVDVKRSFVWTIAEIHSGNRHPIRSRQTINRKIPATRHLADHLVFAKRQTAIGRLVENQSERSCPNNINLAIGTNSGYGAFHRVVFIETVATHVRNPKRHRERLSLIRRAREKDMRSMFGIGAPVNIESRPREIQVSFRA